MNFGIDSAPGASARAGATIRDVNRGRIFIVTLMALFTAGAAVSMRATTAVQMQSEYLAPLGAATAGERLATALGAAFLGFAITLLLVSAVLARIGFGRALAGAAILMTLGFAIVAGAGALGISTYTALLIGMVVQGLGWGLVETVINPLTSALYPEDRVGRLGILHAWYPAGLVGGALFGLAIDHAGLPWRWNMVPLAVLCVIFGVLALREKLPPVSASTDAPVTPGEMLKATIQNPTIFVWVILMMLTASTEFAPGQWLDVALTQIVGIRGVLVLAYVSGLMFVMRHFAGPLVKRLGNIGLLISSSCFAAAGLFALGSADSPVTVLGAATVWGFGVAYFWPTMLATVAERYPRSGTMVFGLMGSAGAACTYVVLPYLGAVYDKGKLAAAGGDANLAANAQGPQLHDILTTAASASFRTAALIPLCLIVIFIATAVADRLQKNT
ncbi:MAG: MFS transporter [Alphaproteobacteria bacterium]|nr:MFS transporter [Alphaproteobacteria bacterium]